MKRSLKRLAAHLPGRLQQELKRHHHEWLRKRGRFVADDPEFRLLPDLVGPGDWVLDVGANVGHYTLCLSNLVGPDGRVFALEPVPETLELLAAAVAHLEHPNTTVLGVAASDSLSIAGMEIPLSRFSGLRNYYQARISTSGRLSVLTLPIDTLMLPKRVSLVKIDAEGHDLSVLRGMSRLLTRDHPILILEDDGAEVGRFLTGFGYRRYGIPDSPNRLYDSGQTVSAAVERRGIELTQAPDG